VVAGSGQPAPLDPTLLGVLGLAALGSAAAIPVVRRALMPGRSDHSGGVSPTRSAATTATQRFNTALIVSLAMAEAIAICGLVLTFLSLDARYVQVFAVFSLINLALYFPRTDAFLGVLRAAAEQRP
jgi:hypothetical protein